LVECIYLNPSYVFCVQVYQRGVPSPLAVGTEMAQITGGFASRRLLAQGLPPPQPVDDAIPLSESSLTHEILMEEWNTTTQPCSALVKAYQQATRAGERVRLGPLDTVHLHSCAYWRLVGRRTIELYNLTSLAGRDTFLLSAEDLTMALMQRWVLVQLLHNPRSVLFALGHWPVLKPLYAAWAVVRTASIAWGINNLAEMRMRNRVNGTTPSPLPEDDASAEEDDEVMEEIFSQEAELEDMVEQLGTNQTGRRLLQKTDIKFAETWLAGPFNWPPLFTTRLGTSTCSAATAMLQIGYEIVSVLAKYYYGSYTSAPRVSKRIRDNLPNLTCSTKMQPVPPAADGWIAGIYHSVWTVLGIEAAYVRELFSVESSTNIFTITTSMLSCDFQAVTFCSKHRKDLFASIIILLILYVILSYFGQLVAIPYVGTALALSFVPVLLWYTYGMAFTCTFMIPTCFFDDVIELTSSVFPQQFAFPTPIQKSPGCLADPTQASCLLRCSEQPMSFVDWRDTLAFGICYSSQSLCASLAASIGESDTLGAKLLAKAAVIDGDDALLSASLFCFAVTFVNIVPALILFMVSVTMAGYVFYLPCVLLPKLFALSAQSIVYLHAE
jgi:hypothetical protein